MGCVARRRVGASVHWRRRHRPAGCVEGELPVAYASQSILRRELGPDPEVPVVVAQGLVESLRVDFQGSMGQGVEPER
jgi:hypothetical protein